MKILHSIVATNSVITLADGSREVIADEALEDGARQVNEGVGLPSFVEHDRQRICGWSHRAWTERDGIALKLVLETEVPETHDEWESLLRRYSDYLSVESDSRTASYKEIAAKCDMPDVGLTYDKEYVFLSAPKLARNYCDAAFTNMDDDGLVPITRETNIRRLLSCALTLPARKLPPSQSSKPGIDEHFASPRDYRWN
jgi:hypothetical protein